MNDYGDSGTTTAPAGVEDRLRAALAARARSVGPSDLRPRRPPTGPPGPRLRLRHAVAGVLALAAVVALVLLTAHKDTPRPTEPAHSPHPAVSTPPPARPSAASPTPNPSPTPTPQFP
ncbi:hypothetical protein NX794_32180 [Streptomyces sp. LP11]|uniref:Uncharacterized protein n=1 Tax=Streptomyces pyxinicus TaxID=2970331 RepID=A0ABT2BBC7_9ACTN|nr:hypothetical protein [Streptomyces sp. LP11]MCS0605828.1 hypothetical protein [Streptomyces sp. LP11]